MKQIIKKILIIIIYIGLIFISTKVYAISGKTTSETTRVRKEPSTDSDIVTLISENTEVEVIGEQGDWYQVSYLEYTGYVRKDLLSVENTVTEAKNTVEESENVVTDVENTVSEPENTVTEEENTTNAENTNNISIGYTGILKSNLEVKILPSINSTVIATITENTNFEVTDIINKWCYIQTESNTGWVLINKVQSNITEQLTPSTTEIETETEAETEPVEETTQTEEVSSSEEKNTTTTKYVSTETLNVRADTDNNANIITQLELNTQVTVEEVVDGTWSKITINGRTGYVASKYLSDTKTTASSRSEDLTRETITSEENTPNKEKTEKQETNTSTSNSTQSTSSSSGKSGAEIANYAKQYLGYKYVSGGTTPSTGFDCSGFTYYVYKNYGITLNRTSSAQASNGTAVSKENLQPGDLLIFNNSSNSAIGHVGIYLGGNNFIHAANAAKGIVTTSLSNSYYQARFVSARRVI